MITLDKLYVNGKFHTLVSEEEVVEAVGVLNERIVFTGTTKEAEMFPVKETIDLGGKTVIPAFEDTHMHLGGTMELFKMVALNSAKCMDDIISLLSEADKNMPEGEWIIGRGFHIERIKEGRFPTKVDLDKASTTRPIYIQSYCGHASMANSKALEEAKIVKGFVPPEGAFYDVDQNGEPTGVLREHIKAYINKFCGPLIKSDEDAFETLQKVLEQYASFGYTTVQSNEHCVEGGNRTVKDLIKLKNAGKLPVRVIVDYSFLTPNPLGATTGFGDDMLKIGSEKFFVDGSMNSHTAAMIEPYTSEPRHKGQLIYEKDELFIEAVKKSYDYGNSIAAHTIGDYAMDLMIRAIENCYDPEDSRRFRIIHAMLVNGNELERLKKLPVVLDTQPNFLLNWVNSCIENIGEERAKLFLPYRTYLDEGLIVTGGSDSPVEIFNPFVGIQCAVTRQDMDHSPAEVFEPQECISVFEAVCLYTKNAAYSNNEEKCKGTIEIGKYADFAVLDQDIFTVDPYDISKITVAYTVLGGKIVYSEK